MKETELIGIGIKTLRKQLNMTLADIAADTGLSISYLSKIERNQGNVTLDAISKICAAFHIDLVKFLSMDFTKDVIHIHKNERSVISTLLIIICLQKTSPILIAHPWE